MVRVAEAGGEVGDPVVSIAQHLDGQPVGVRDVRYGHGFDREDDHVLVQDLVVFDVRAQRQRGCGLAAVEEHSGPGHPGQPRLDGMDLVDERPKRPLVKLALAGDQCAALLPGGEDREHRDGDDQRKPGAMDELGQVGGEEEQVNRQERGRGRHDHPQWLAPVLTGDIEEQQRGDGDRAGHCHAERVGQRVCGLERDDEREDRDHQRPVDPRDVDLAHLLFGGIRDAQPRKIADLGGLLGKRESARDYRLRGDDRRRGGQENHRQPRPPGYQQEKRAGDGAPVAEDQGALSHVAEDAGGENQDQPDARNRRAAEVPHVRVQRLGSGDGQDHGGQREERGGEMPGQEANGVTG